MDLTQYFIVNNDCYQANVNKQDSRYTTFQTRGPLALMLHSVGCAQPQAMVFAKRWNKAGVQKAVHAFIDANTGQVVQTMPWNYRAWHCGGSGNNTHIGVETCESAYIKYTSANKFEILDRTKAVNDCMRAYHSTVELFAMLCKQWGLNPLTDICSHKEGWYKGIASNHGDPEHYWNGLGMNYTMDGFRQAVKIKMEDVLHDMTQDEFNQILNDRLSAQRSEFEERVRQISNALSDDFETQISTLMPAMDDVARQAVTDRIGKEIVHLADIPSKGVRKTFAPLLEEEIINGGTPADVDATDIRLPWAVVRAIAVLKLYTDKKDEALRDWVRGLLESEPDPEGGDPEGECGETCPIFFPDETPGAGEE